MVQWYFNSWTGNYTAKIDLKTGNLTILEPPTKDSQPRRIWSDSKGHLWITEWATGSWPNTIQRLKNGRNGSYLVRNHNHIRYMLTRRIKCGSVILEFKMVHQSMLRFDPDSEKFEVFPLPSDHSNIRQMNGRPGQVWGAESGLDRIIVFSTGNKTS